MSKYLKVNGMPLAPEYTHWQLEKAEHSVENGPENFEYETWSVNLVEPGEDVLSQLVYDLSDLTIVEAANSLLGRYMSRNRAQALEEGPVGLH